MLIIHIECIPSPLNRYDSLFLTLQLREVDDSHASSPSEYPISELRHGPHKNEKDDSSNGDANDISCEATLPFGGIEEAVHCGSNNEFNNSAQS